MAKMVRHGVPALKRSDPVTCYVACEVLYHLFDLRAKGWSPAVVQHGGDTHWFLRHGDGRVIDPTAFQFETAPPYSSARGCGFLTKGPSKRARRVLEALR
jgi:hypothetical protein